MAIANYSTKLGQERSVEQIRVMLARHGASSISFTYTNKQPSAVLFVISAAGREIPFQLPCKWPGVLEAMKRDPNIPSKYKTERQARRTAWRITHDWLRAQLAIVEAEQAELVEVFLPYAVLSDGQTVYQAFSDKGFPALAPARR